MPATVIGLLREARLAVINEQKLLADAQISYSKYWSNTVLARAQQVGGEYLRARQIANAGRQPAAAAHYHPPCRRLIDNNN
jgi:hypothetical protein